jgi:tetratricopeptide (TPR) repeat protein
MKPLLILLFIACFVSMPGWAQDSLIRSLEVEVCQALAKEKKISNEVYRNIFEQSLRQQHTVFAEECLKKFGDSTNDSQEKFANQIFDSISVQLVYSCRPYYRFIDEVRYDGILGQNKDSVVRQINIMNASSPELWTASTFTKRGILFLQVARLDFALLDFEEALRMDPVAIQAMYGKAWVLELKKRYEEAFDLYQRLYILTGNNMYQIFAAVVERKKGK